LRTPRKPAQQDASKNLDESDYSRIKKMGYFDWVWELYGGTEDDVIRSAGIGAQIYLIFMKRASLYYFCIGVIGIVLLFIYGKIDNVFSLFNVIDNYNKKMQCFWLTYLITLIDHLFLFVFHWDIL